MPPADGQRPSRRHARWGTQLEESRWLHASFTSAVAVRNHCSRESAALVHNRTAGPMKVRLRTRLVHRRPTAGMCATSQVEDHAFRWTAPPRRHHHVLIRIRRWKEGRPLADSHKPWLIQAGFTASLPHRRLKQRAQGTAATASVSAVPGGARHSSAEPLEPSKPPAQRLWREAP